MMSPRLVLSALLAVSPVTLFSCSKSVDFKGKTGGSTQAVTEPSPLPSATGIPSPSPTVTSSPNPTPSPSPSTPVGACDEAPIDTLAMTSLFSRGKMELNDVLSEGSVSALMSSTVTRSEVGSALETNEKRNDLAVRGELKVSNTKALHGRIVASRKLNSTRLEAPLGHGIQNLDALKGEEAKLMALHDRLGKAKTTGDSELVCEQRNYCELRLTGRLSGANVFNVTSEDLRDADAIRFFVPTSASAVVRVTGTKLTTLNLKVRTLDLGGMSSERLLWNPRGLRNLIIHQRQIPGTWIAPGTLFQANDTEFSGSVFTSCMTANHTKFTHKTFNGCLPETAAIQ